MTRLTAMARAVRLAVRAKAETLTAAASQAPLYLHPLVTRAIGTVRWASRAYGKTLIAEASQVRYASHVAKAISLIAVVRTDLVPFRIDRSSSVVNMSAVGEFVLG